MLAGAADGRPSLPQHWTPRVYSVSISGQGGERDAEELQFYRVILTLWLLSRNENISTSRTAEHSFLILI